MPERTDHRATTQISQPDQAVWMPHDWLARQYWPYSWSLLAMALPLAALAGGAADAVGLGIYAALTAACHLGDRLQRGMGVRLHLIGLVPYWALYTSFEAGMPARHGHGAPGFVVMLLFPILVITALSSSRGILAIAVASLAAVVHRFGWTTESGVGAFLVGLGLLIGFVFRLPVRKLERSYRTLQRAASTDPLTELPNRRGFDALLGRKVPTKGDATGFVVLVDLMRFRAINDGFGHGVGDELLVAVADRIVELTRQEPGTGEVVVARVDGDEFAVASFGGSLEQATELGRRLVEALSEVFEIRAHVLHLGIHVGIACFDGPHDAAVLLGRARQALYTGRANDESVSAYHEERTSLPHLELELRQALERGELVPHFQPVCDLLTGAIVGVEALVRWNHPTRGLLPPAAFIAPAEACGLMTEIDRCVLRASVQQVERWLEEGRDMWVAVNVSARTLEDTAFAGRIAALLEQHPCARRRLVIEITESAAMRNPEPCAKLLGDLHEMGVDSALDDFGMGYSSLAYLKRLPATHLKLDRMFVSGIGVSERDEGVVELLLDLARKFQMDVVAEGIETNEQLEWLRDRSCRFAQGYLLGKPVPAAEVPKTLERKSGVFEVPPNSARRASLTDGEASPSREVAKG